MLPLTHHPPVTPRYATRSFTSTMTLTLDLDIRSTLHSPSSTSDRGIHCSTNIARRSAAMSLPLHLRAYQEPTRDDLTRLLFNVPPLLWVMPQASPSYDPATDPKLVKDPRHEQAMKEKMEMGGAGMMSGTMGMEISAILSVEGKDEVYVRRSCYPARRLRDTCDPKANMTRASPGYFSLANYTSYPLFYASCRSINVPPDSPSRCTPSGGSNGMYSAALT